jgi:hypothetical protein
LNQQNIEETNMFCTNCGASNKNGRDLCINCGESLRNGQIEDRLSRLRAINDEPPSNRFDFLHHLFDFSLHRPVTLKMLKSLHILSILFAGWLALFLVLVGFEISLWLGTVTLLTGAPVLFFLTVIFTRVFCEMILSASRMADHKTDGGVAERGGLRAKEKTEPRENIQWNV